VTTLAQLADRAQNALNDAAVGTWPQDTVEAWCRDAIADYATHFVRIQNQTITCVAGQHWYVLATLQRGILSVEYPKGEDPPRYLARRPVTHPQFWDQDGYYDVEDYRDHDQSDHLWISDTPTAGEEIEVIYNAMYNSIALASAHTIEVPPEHEPLLLLFVVFRAHTERMSTESQHPDTTIRMLQQMKLAVQAAEYAYHQALRDAKKTQAVGGWVPPWEVDGYDRIY
jgi:hypothetical protein